MKQISFIALFLSILLVTVVAGGHGKKDDDGRKGKFKLDKNFYKKTCPQVEKVSQDITWARVKANPSLAAKLLRIHYHDCFVRGCDASLLLDTPGGEKEAVPNRALTGFEVIDEIKATLEAQCPGNVSCADITTLVARDAVSFQYQKPLWEVFLGRRDGRVSLSAEATKDLPSASSNFTTLLTLFQKNDLDLMDLVSLSGAHTIGRGRCVIFQRRLFNFTGEGDTDPSLDPQYANILKSLCGPPSNPATTSVEMDPGSSLSFDTNYYKTVNQRKGLFQSDASLLTDGRSLAITRQFQDNPKAFFRQFGLSMVNMGAIGVLTGTQGEIRSNCRVVN